MNALKTIYSIIVHGFLGFVWMLFIGRMLAMYTAAGKSALMFILVIAGSILFLDILTRVLDSFSKDKKAPVRIAGYAAFGAVVILQLITR